MKKRKSVVLLSGGIDSTTCLYWAIKKGFSCYCLIFDYGQRHIKEIKTAQKIAKKLKIRFKLIKLNLPWLKKSSLIDSKKKLPCSKISRIKNSKIPSTYVALRNLMFLSIAESYADVINADTIIIGVNIIDYSGYPDCRPEFINTFEKAANLGGKFGKVKILTPLIKLTKHQIIKLASKLKVPFKLTWSCYLGDKKPCGKCDSCKLRAEGFKKAALCDPLIEN